MGQIKKLHKIKCFLIISVNLDPKCQVPKPKSAFYQNTLIEADLRKGPGEAFAP